MCQKEIFPTTRLMIKSLTDIYFSCKFLGSNTLVCLRFDGLLLGNCFSKIVEYFVVIGFSQSFGIDHP